MRRITERNNANLPTGFEYHTELAGAATAEELKAAPRHRWFYFPHSYSYRLVDAILNLWGLSEGRTIADNFAGSGTTLLAARQRGIAAFGFDLSPLAVMVTNSKIACYSTERLGKDLANIIGSNHTGETSQISGRLSRAFTQKEMQEITKMLEPIRRLDTAAQRFFLVALLQSVKPFSRAVADGGWFRWSEWPDRNDEIRPAFIEQVTRMIEDAERLNWSNESPITQAQIADARKLPLPASSVDGLITSPPYANRHDYSRIFHIELLLLGLTEPEVTKVRHGSIRSHTEAKKPNGYDHRMKDYRKPALLETALTDISGSTDPRIKRFIEGYFEDIYLSLTEVERILRPGGQAAYIIGNVRHGGRSIPSDEITGQLIFQAGMRFERAWVMRLRGNSAQQMGRHGREPSRETIVFMSKDD